MVAPNGWGPFVGRLTKSCVTTSLPWTGQRDLGLDERQVLGRGRPNVTRQRFDYPLMDHEAVEQAAAGALG